MNARAPTGTGRRQQNAENHKTMNDMLKVGKRYFPLQTLTYAEDDGEQVILSFRDVRSGPSEFRFFGAEAERLRDWLRERVALALDPEEHPDDTGVRDDD